MHTSRVGDRLMAAEQVTAVLGRHVVGVDQILDADRQTIDRRQWAAVAMACAGFVGRLARALEIEERERHHRRLQRLDALDAALQIGARRIAAVAEFRHGVVEAQHPVCRRIIDAGGGVVGHASFRAPRSGEPGIHSHSL